MFSFLPAELSAQAGGGSRGSADRALAVSIFLVTSYMRLALGARLALVEIGLGQLVYRVSFSNTFFFTGYTGLAITLLCIATLFAAMQFTGRTDWNAVFKKKAAPPGSP